TESEKQAVSTAKDIGYPVLIKASAGGGGRGMRVAHSEASLKTEIGHAQAEAKAAFGNSAVYLEKYIEHPRHIEVQVIADHHGNVLHLYERDCTLQRRHQKLIEESPAPKLDAKLRNKICDSATRLAKIANYTSAGTCEFLVDKHGE